MIVRVTDEFICVHSSLMKIPGYVINNDMLYKKGRRVVKTYKPY